MPAVHVHMSGLWAEIDAAAAPRAERTLASIWGASSQRAYVAPTLRAVLRVAREGEAFVVSADDERIESTTDERLVCPIIEQWLYGEFVRAEALARRTILHAAGFVDGDTTYILAGESGAGKSALARAALARGLRYFSDEHLITDGHGLWGVPRAVHLDLEPAEREPAPWHTGVDRHSYVFPNQAGQLLRIPFQPVPPAALVDGPRSLSGAVLVRLARSATNEVAELSAVERLALVETANFLPSPALSRVALTPRAYALGWREPEDALAQLLGLASTVR